MSVALNNKTSKKGEITPKQKQTFSKMREKKKRGESINY